MLATLEQKLDVEFVMAAGVTQPKPKTLPLSGSAQANATAAGSLTTEPDLTIPEAKRRLARTLGLNESQIEINVRA